MSDLILPKGQIHEQVEGMLQRITLLSEQVNYLLRELYKQSNGDHGVFKRNTKLTEDVRTAIQLEAEGSRQVKETIATPEFTREQIKKLNAEMNK